MNFLTARELLQRLQRKEISAREVLDAHLQQIERVNPKVNAIVTLVADAARDRAQRLDDEAAHGRFAGPLHGLPVAHKDLFETRGIRTTYGSPLFRDYVPDFNAPLIDRIQNAGAVTIGKTNTPEFGAGSQTFNPVFGPTRNPWDFTKTCGGSSGGAAVALACGMVPLADGSDMGGSLRNPASFCSVVGFRTSPGVVPRVTTGDPWSDLAVDGPMARNVEDVALFLSVIAERGERFAGSLERGCEGLRIAWCGNFAGLPFDPRVRQLFQDSRKTFETLGCITEDADPDFSGADQAFKVLRARAFFALHPVAQPEMKRTVIQEIERGSHITPAGIAEAVRLRSALQSRVGNLMSKYDFLLLPATQTPAFSIELEYVSEIDGVTLETYIDWMRSCYFITMTSLPAISIPAGLTPDGLPVGLQIVGRPGDDFGVLQLARAFEGERHTHIPRQPSGILAV